MTISVSPERSTLSLPGLRPRTQDGGTVRAGPNGRIDDAGQRSGSAAISVSRSSAPEAGALRATTSGLDRASSVADVSLAAFDTVIGLLGQARDAVAGGQGTQAATLLLQVQDVVGAAEFDGANLLDGSLAGGLRVADSGEGELAVTGYDLRPGGPVITLDPQAERGAALSQAEGSLGRALGARQTLQDDSKRLGAHRAFVGLLSEAVTGGKEGLDVEGARLAALQIKQTLGGTSLALTSAAPQSVLALFR